MERAIDRAVAVLAAPQGVAHVAQLRRAGVTDRQVATRLRSGSWCEVAEDVVAASGAPDTPLRRVWCAVLAVRTRAGGGERPVAAGGRTAAWLLAVRAAPGDPVELVVPRDVWTPRPAGVRVRKVTDWTGRRFVRRAGLLVTALPDTLVDLAPHLSDDDYLALLQEQCFADATLLGRVVARCHSGRNGSARARRAGARLAAGLDSPLHARGVAVLRTAGLAPSACGVEVLPGAGPSDCVYRAGGRPVLALEFDGDLHRLSRKAFLHDRAKDLALASAGCSTVRLTVEQVDRPATLVAAVRRALAAAEVGISPGGVGVA